MIEWLGEHLALFSVCGEVVVVESKVEHPESRWSTVIGDQRIKKVFEDLWGVQFAVDANQQCKYANMPKGCKYWREGERDV